MWTVKKVLNSSVVLATDDTGVEAVLLGKGIGYGRKADEAVDASAIDQVFVARSNDGDQLRDLLEEIPSWYLEFTHEVVQAAEQQLGSPLDPHVYLSLTDHLHFAVQRAEQGLALRNRLASELQVFYPAEYGLAEEALERLRARVAVPLPDDEAANIAFHLVNASRTEQGFNALKAVKLIDDVASIVRYSTPQLEATRLHWARFLTHVKFFVERFLADKLLASPDDFLFGQIQRRYPESLEVAERVRQHILATENSHIPNEEVAYLALHIQRLAGDSSDRITPV